MTTFGLVLEFINVTVWPLTVLAIYLVFRYDIADIAVTSRTTTTITIMQDVLGTGNMVEIDVTKCCHIGPITKHENYCAKCGRKIVSHEKQR